MPNFSKKSLEILSTCELPLQVLMRLAIQSGQDFSIICGHRGEEEQNEAFAQGHSKLRYPKSKHNTSPSQAVDIAPYPIDFSDIQRFKKLSVIIKDTWSKMSEIEKAGWELQWGGDWKTFRDYPHWELRKNE